MISSQGIAADVSDGGPETAASNISRRSAFGNTEGHLYQALASGRYPSGEDERAEERIGQQHQENGVVKKFNHFGTGMASGENSVEHGYDQRQTMGRVNSVTPTPSGMQNPKGEAGFSGSNAHDGNPNGSHVQQPSSPEPIPEKRIPTIARNNKVYRRSSLQNTTVASFFVSDLYRCRTIRRILEHSPLLQRAQRVLTQDIPLFCPADFGLDVRRHLDPSSISDNSSSCRSFTTADDDFARMMKEITVNNSYNVFGNKKSGHMYDVSVNGQGLDQDANRRVAKVIGQSSAYFTIYGIEYFEGLLHRDEEESCDGKSVASSHSKTRHLKTKQYVIKKVNHDLLTPNAMAEKPKAIPQAAITLAMEAHFLASVSRHPHIIRLRGSADPNTTPMGQMFFIVDRLEETLDRRIARGWKLRWQQQQRRNSGPGNIMTRFANAHTSASSKRTKAQENMMQEIQFQMERYTAARDLASAIGHLHKHRVLHRDIKPENVGFTYAEGMNNAPDGKQNVKKGKRPSGVIQLFDFGIATEMPKNPSLNDDQQDSNGGADGVGLIEVDDSSFYNKDETYKMTQRVGSIRYMAPEVYLGRPYGTSADVYSLAVVMFEMFSLQIPYDDMSERCMKTLVFERGMRPMDIPPYWNEKLSFLVTTSWSQTSRYRPSAVDIVARLDALRDEARDKMVQVLSPPPEADNASMLPSNENTRLGRTPRRSSLTTAVKRIMPRRSSIEKITRRASLSGLVPDKTKQELTAAIGEGRAAASRDFNTKACGNTDQRSSFTSKRGSGNSVASNKSEKRCSFRKEDVPSGERRGSGSSVGISRHSDKSDKPTRRQSFEKKLAQAANNVKAWSGHKRHDSHVTELEVVSDQNLQSSQVATASRNQRPIIRRHSLDHKFGQYEEYIIKYNGDARELPQSPNNSSKAITATMKQHRPNQLVQHIEHHKEEERRLSGGRASDKPQTHQTQEIHSRASPRARRSSMTKYSAQLAAQAAADAEAKQAAEDMVAAAAAAASFRTCQPNHVNAPLTTQPALQSGALTPEPRSDAQSSSSTVRVQNIQSRATQEDLKAYCETKSPSAKSRASKMFRRLSF